MRNGLFVLILMTLAAGVVSCEKKPINGKLDGRWQLMNIAYHNADDAGLEDPGCSIYYSFQLRLMQFSRAGDDGYLSQNAWGRFVYTEDSLHVRLISDTNIKVDFSTVQLFGMNDTIQHFGVEELTHKKMVLNSDYARLEFRKF